MFVTKHAEQKEAKRLRREGHSLREIAFKLDVALSSASLWVRGIPRGGVEVGLQAEPDASGLAPKEEPRRKCGKCGESLPESAFNRHPRNERQWWCRNCFRVYFRERGQLHREQSAAAKRERQAAARGFIAEYLTAHPCVDCGESEPTVLEFDHVGEKTGGLSVLKGMGYSVERLRAEIAECQVVCVNCHRRRTGRRAGWRRARKDWWRTPPPKPHPVARNYAFAYSYLERTPCRDCGETDICVLDFDHVGRKTRAVVELARRGVKLAQIEMEIANCEVRCGNCHRRRTAQQTPDASSELAKLSLPP